MAGALPAALSACGAEPRVLLPGFAPILADLHDAVELARLTPPAGLEAADVRLLRAGCSPARRRLCDRRPRLLPARAGGPYADAQQHAYPDNHRRFALLGWTAGQLAQGLDGAGGHRSCTRTTGTPRWRRPRVQRTTPASAACPRPSIRCTTSPTRAVRQPPLRRTGAAAIVLQHARARVPRPDQLHEGGPLLR
ncbi:glycogen/starch synthase [Thauera humireducens]|uniref:glycogen/starch synthase n=1 Tax=Thauera humireducens TaxID=1134435 RepID=UPI003C752EFB